MLIWHESPLLSMQLLWINLVTDSLPAIALGMEPVESDVMEQKPRPKNEGIFAGGLGVRIILQGILFGCLTLGAYFIGRNVYGDTAIGQTMAFIVLACSQVFHSFNMRSSHSLFKIGPFTNKRLNLAAVTSFVLTLAVLLIPAVNTIFGLVYLNPAQYAIAFGLAFSPIIIMEIVKLCGFLSHEHANHKK